MIHLLTPASDLRHCVVACGAAEVAYGTWTLAHVTCPACKGARGPCTCRPGTPLCAVCRGWQRTHRADGSRRATPLLPTIRTEADLQEAVRKEALAQGWYYFHVYDSRRSPAGFVDTVLAKPEQPLVLCELKTETGRLTPAQEAWGSVLSTITQVEYHVWRPGDWATIVEKLS